MRCRGHAVRCVIVCGAAGHLDRDTLPSLAGKTRWPPGAFRREQNVAVRRPDRKAIARRIDRQARELTVREFPEPDGVLLVADVERDAPAIGESRTY